MHSDKSNVKTWPKEMERVKVEYEKPAVVLGRIEVLQGEINEAIKEFREKYF